ncbi:hypothetical protein CEXT_443571 [Caerostris extrusa]|uniref:Uncharacterized protein n=1 Tax=Caerostris extrusa TaxID=172846 RepID=A0AAV4S976_CAEEX|nr:hypothetical protein CEXT_443571 [Caerostris extrusa]
MILYLNNNLYGHEGASSGRSIFVSPLDATEIGLTSFKKEALNHKENDLNLIFKKNDPVHWKHQPVTPVHLQFFRLIFVSGLTFRAVPVPEKHHKQAPCSTLPVPLRLRNRPPYRVLLKLN